MAAYGNLNVILNNTSLEFNTAENGGGIFVKGLKSGSGTIVDYNSGIIRYNMANSTSQIETAYNKTHTEAGGIGGGIYMGHTPTSDSILLKSLEYTATGRPMLLMTCST